MTTIPKHQELGGAAARGFAWLGLLSVVEKIASGIGQVALAWLLLPDAFKVVALTYTVTVFASLMQSAGIREVLQQRQKRLDVWVTPAFWLSLVFGAVSAMAVIALSSLAADFYNEPRLRSLLIVAALGLPLSSMSIVPEVIIRSHLRFGLVTWVGSVSLVGQMALAVAFAAAGMGPLSIILPQPIMALVRLLLYWNAARPKIRHGPRPGRWKYLLGDSAAMMVGSIAFMITYQAGQMLLGKLFPLSAVAGIYYFCTVLADQSVRVLTTNLAGVLLPALSRIQDDRQRLSKAVVNASGLLLLIGVPMCALQAALAGPLIRVFFNDSWLPAIGCFAAISVAAIGRLVQCPSESMLQAQGRFRAYMTLAIVYAAAFVGSMYAAAKWSPEGEVTTWVAAAGGACLLLLGPAMFTVAMGPSAAGRLVRMLGVPLVMTAISLVPTGVMLYVLPAGDAWDVVTIAVGTLTCGGIYLLLVRKMAAAEWKQLGVRVVAAAPVRYRGVAATLMMVAPPAKAAALSSETSSPLTPVTDNPRQTD